MQSRLDKIRVTLANAPIQTEQVKNAKLEVAILCASISKLQKEAMTAEEVMNEFVENFLQPYLAGQSDPNHEPERQTLLAQLKAHLNERGHGLEPQRIALYASLQFVI